MRILMLGWEFPPFISGGLGTACYGLTKALNRQNAQVLFVLPKTVDKSHSSHVKLLSPDSHLASITASVSTSSSSTKTLTQEQIEEYKRLKLLQQKLQDANPYNTPMPLPGEPGYELMTEQVKTQIQQTIVESAGGLGPVAGTSHQQQKITDAGADYAGDVLTQAQNYRDIAVSLSLSEDFDVIHAHDWMTYPAGLAIARHTGKPLVIHVHSTEFDRSGETVNQTIYDIERRGMHGAIRVITVSYLTRNICIHRYGVNAEKIDVCYNGIDTNGPAQPSAQLRKGDKIVLSLGRITHQKGPEYFVLAAKKVLEKIDNVKFVMAGSGDMVPKVMTLAKEMGIEQKVLFTGFLRGRDVERVFSMADVFVMPSVSEPFGIAPLEAIRHDTPVIISKNSGVAEVLQHALKVDFWDVDEMANKIVAVLKHPPLSQTLREHADLEVRSLTWDGAATKCLQTYNAAINNMFHTSAPLH